MSIAALTPRKILVAICLLFIATRVYKIAEIPSSVYWDEASIGYNAYSILSDGKDEWGKFLPIHFRAFGEFKLPVYIYLIVPSIKLFGLNTFSIRIPAVLFSLITVLLVYFLAKKITKDNSVSLLSAFFLSISPWFFIFSRAGYEATVGLMFYLLGILLFLNSEKNKWMIFFCTVSLVLSAYSYNSFRFLVPLAGLLLLFIKPRNLLRKELTLQISLSFIFIIISLVPIYRVYNYDSGSSRLQAVSGDYTHLLVGYLSNFSPQYLFISGDKNLRSQQTGFGQLLLLDIIFLPLGLIYIIRKKSKLYFLILGLLLIAPLPSAITKESPHALRTISIVPFLAIVSSLGVISMKNYFSNTKVMIYVAVIPALFLFGRYFASFIISYPTLSSFDWQWGYKKIYVDYKNEFFKYDQVFISDEYAQPYIFGLFYLQYSPASFRESVIRNEVSSWGFSTVSQFDKFKFGKSRDFIKDNTKNSLIFSSERLTKLNPIDEIKVLDGKTVFWVYKL